LSATFQVLDEYDLNDAYLEKEPISDNGGTRYRSKRISTQCVDNKTALQHITLEKQIQIKANIKKILNNFDDVKIVKWIGQGKYGDIFEICDPNLSSLRFIVKVSKSQQSFEKEFKMQMIFYENGLAIKPIGYVNDILVMDKIDGIVLDLLKTDLPKETLDNIIVGILDLITRMCELQLAHADLHFGNIGYQINIETREVHFLLLDFDEAVSGRCNPRSQLEMLSSSTFKIESHLNMQYISQTFERILLN
jgi:predicted Ser/Thr protein kinase